MPMPANFTASVPLLLSVLCACLLKVTVGYGLCWAVTRYALSAAVRFAVWLTFLLSAALFWIGSVTNALLHLRGGNAHLPPSPPPAPGLHAVLSSAQAAAIGQLMLALGTVYLLTLCALLAGSAWKRLQLQRALRFRSLPPEPLSAAFDQIAQEVRAPRCALWLLPGLPSPASLGVIHFAVYLPADEGSRTPQQLHDVLVHELFHVRRRDGLWEMLGAACRTLLFFHPAAHAAFSALRLERELACDALVVQGNPAERDLYADTLVRFGWKASLAGGEHRMGIGFTSQARVLQARVQAILAGERKSSRWASSLRAILSTGACWSFAAAAPALWIGFSLGSGPVAQVESSPLDNLSSRARPLHHGGSSGAERVRFQAVSAGLDRSTGSPSAAANAPLGDSPWREPAVDRNRGFHVQNEDESMFNPSFNSNVEPGEAGGPEATGPAARGKLNRQALPSPAAIALETAVQLRNLGVGRDGDHGHD